MPYTSEPAWGDTVDVDSIAFDRLDPHETTKGAQHSGRNGGKRRGAE